MLKRNPLLRSPFILIVLVLFVSLSLAVFSSAAQTSTAPLDVAKALVAAEYSNNVNAAVALFANDAVVTLPPPFGVLNTPNMILAWQQELAANHFRLEPINMQADGNVVTWTGNVSYDPFRDMGIASMDANWKLDIEDGKVKTFDFNFTPDALVKLQAGSTAAALMAAENAYDVDAAVALFADDAVVTLADGSVKDTPDKIRAWEQELADGHFRLEPVARYVDGDTVTWNGEVAWDFFRQLGLPSLASVWKLVIDNGKVETFDFNFTPAAGQAFGAALAAMATPEATAASQ